MKLHLEIWRQAGPQTEGHFESVDVDDAVAEMSILELLDHVNTKYVESGKEPFAAGDENRLIRVKDGGDDIDATTGLPVIAAVTLLPDAPRTVTIDGGAGVGRVTKPGLDQPVGAAAINRVPRQMITEALLREADAVGYGGGFAVVISIEGEVLKQEWV